MPFVSEKQRRWMHANEPEMARRWEHETSPRRLPERVKRAYSSGMALAHQVYGVGEALDAHKEAAEEIRLKIPKRQFHGHDAAFRRVENKNQKKADHNDQEMTPPLEQQADGDKPVERLTALLQQINVSPESQNDTTQNPLDRASMWGHPSTVGIGDAAGVAGDNSSSKGSVF